MTALGRKCHGRYGNPVAKRVAIGAPAYISRAPFVMETMSFDD
jgi:hypothetical protein